MPLWRLPDHVADVLPAEARKLEELRRVALDIFRSHGYELIQPPLLEYLDSLITGVGRDLEASTFKLIDQLSGRTMGIRADITPQAARIDAHLLNRSGVTRLAYCGHLLHTTPRSPLGSREPIQLGAELYGYAGVHADGEILDLALNLLQHVLEAPLVVSLSHVGIVQAVLGAAANGSDWREAAANALVCKDRAALTKIADLQVRDDLLAVLDATGPLGGAGLAACRQRLQARHPDTAQAFADLLRVAETVAGRAQVLFDLADTHSYGYHNGITFAVFAPGGAAALARGGRYDTALSEFGRARAATGFSMDLRDLSRLVAPPAPARAIAAAWQDAADWRDAVASLRAAGEIVVVEFPGALHEHDEFSYDRELVHEGGQWVVRARA
ncbi:MAG TPA: ATP phosphoribosyltransferase regulatory subunit [Burkholderiaceae bacterium]|nr:ATP phosphoribosyltransferase regulatory subunit [Burkholderiaceae bacterium]